MSLRLTLLVKVPYREPTCLCSRRSAPPFFRHLGQHMDDGLFLAPKPIGTVRFAQL